MGGRRSRQWWGPSALCREDGLCRHSGPLCVCYWDHPWAPVSLSPLSLDSLLAVDWTPLRRWEVCVHGSPSLDSDPVGWGVCLWAQSPGPVHLRRRGAPCPFLGNLSPLHICSVNAYPQPPNMRTSLHPPWPSSAHFIPPTLLPVLSSKAGGQFSVSSSVPSGTQLAVRRSWE